MPIKNLIPENLPVTGHLEELRARLLYVLAYVTAGTIVGLFFAKDLIRLLEMPAAANLSSFVLIKPTDVVSIYFKMSLYIGAVIAAPAAAYNFWHFIKPAVPGDVRVSPGLWSLSAAVLFGLGTFFSYKILLPSGYKFLMGLSAEIATPMITLNSYLSFALSIIVIGGFIFEMPVIAALLTRLRVITPKLLTAKWREAVFGLCVIAAVVTPTTDVFNMLLFVAPMLALFGISVLVSLAVHKIYVKDPSGEDYGN